MNPGSDPTLLVAYYRVSSFVLIEAERVSRSCINAQIFVHRA